MSAAIAGSQGGERIYVKVNGQDGSEIFFRIKRTLQLRKLMTAYCSQRSTELCYVAFLFDGARLHPEKTPNEVGMEDGDEIDAVVHQIGG